jgi:hypothetical protein
MALLVDTETVAAEDRFDVRAGAHRRIFLPLGVMFLDPEPLRRRILGHRLGPLDLFRICADASAVRRTERTIAALQPERPTLFHRAYGCTPRDARANGSAPHFAA